MADWVRVALIAAGMIPFVICMGYALQIEQKAGWYECAKCGHKYVPTYKSVLWAMHVNRTRYMMCPECGEKSWQRKRISKD
jgi:DNA-directed RNA polymerase subunit RPC12/RpoP